MTRHLLILPLALFLLTAPLSALAWPGTVLSVHDGDTITVARNGKAATPVIVRFYGIDAPELNQPYGVTARDWLKQALPAGQRVKITPYGKDQYGRTVALVHTTGHVLNAKLLDAGYAWVYPNYCKAKFCKQWTKAQSKAQSKRAGLWADKKAVQPWKWRRK